MRLLSRLLLAVGFASATFLTSCETAPKMAGGSGNYKVTALRPKNPENVKVKLSTSTQHVYVMEGDRLLMAVQGTVGVGNTTPMGNFRITRKEKNKRRISQPDRGYPMAYWCEIKPAYGFHEGFVHSRPRSHGCIRLHREAAARLFALVKVGTPVNISTSQPEDSKYGHLVRKLDQSKDPDPPRALLMSPAWFKDPVGPLLVDG